jgi:hypothetical protein
MTACPKCLHPHVVKAGKIREKQRWRPGMWVSIYPDHAAGQTFMAKGAGGLSLLSRRLDECAGQDVRRPHQFDLEGDPPLCDRARCQA